MIGMYLCVRGIDFASFNSFCIRFWNCSEGVDFFVFVMLYLELFRRCGFFAFVMLYLELFRRSCFICKDFQTR